MLFHPRLVTGTAATTRRAARARSTGLDLTSECAVKLVGPRPIEEHARLRDVLTLIQWQRLTADESQRGKREAHQKEGAGNFEHDGGGGELLLGQQISEHNILFPAIFSSCHVLPASASLPSAARGERRVLQTQIIRPLDTTTPPTE